MRKRLLKIRLSASSGFLPDLLRLDIRLLGPVFQSSVYLSDGHFYCRHRLIEVSGTGLDAPFLQCERFGQTLFLHSLLGIVGEQHPLEDGDLDIASRYLGITLISDQR